MRELHHPPAYQPTLTREPDLPKEVRSNVRWLGEYFLVNATSWQEWTVARNVIRLASNPDTKESVLVEYLGICQPFRDGLLDPALLQQEPYGPELPPAISLGSIALESPANDEQDAA
jgi:hypothetical protein